MRLNRGTMAIKALCSYAAGRIRYLADRQKSALPDIRSAGEVACMKRGDAPVVHCEYAEAGKELSRLLEESFRLYLARVLDAPEREDSACAQ